MSLARTSLTHPLRVDFIPGTCVALPGRIGLTFAPGKKQRHAQTGSWHRDLDTDLRALRDEFGADVLVSLIEEHEFERLQIQALRVRAPHFGIESLWFPIRDQSVPASVSELHELVGRITERLREGKTVVIHCMGGLVRTGLVAAACLLAVTELSPREAVTAARKARKGSVETEEQAGYLETYHEHLRNLGLRKA